MKSFEKTTFQFLQNLNFHSKLTRFVLGFTQSLDANISGMNNNYDESSSITKWKFSTCIPFKTLITQHQDMLPLIHMKIYI